MKILAIDTSTEVCSVALNLDGVVYEEFTREPRKHSDLVLVMTDRLLSAAGLKVADLDAIAFGRGPGGFTGLRIAAGVAQGLAFGADLPVIPISTLAAHAQGIHREYGAERVLIANDAGMQEVYWGAFQWDGRTMIAAVPEAVGRAETIVVPQTVQPWVGAGSGWRHYRAVLEARIGAGLAQCYADSFPRAHDIAVMAEAPLRAGQAVSAEHAVPVYVRDNVV
ncbi:MAG: tRNA (adenosine(37)-N6)-threonylcarbamoyltransferase complex dimerization subunit type 1 TsaB [Pseudomonadota bacterium]